MKCKKKIKLNKCKLTVITGNSGLAINVLELELIKKENEEEKEFTCTQRKYGSFLDLFNKIRGCIPQTHFDLLS